MSAVTTSLPRCVGVVGVGLLGGSLVRALRAADEPVSVVAVEPSEPGRRAIEAAALGVELHADLGPSLAACQLVVLAAPIAAIVDLLGPVSARMRDGAVLSDVGGVKGPVIEAARRAVRREVHFVGAHPMFGGEEGGFSSSRADLWRDGTVAVCTDDADPGALEVVRGTHQALGASVIECTADAHDAAVAVVSHLPYVVSSAFSLLASESGSLAQALAGRGFDDLTRLSQFDFGVQGEVARRNPHLPAAAAALQGHLSRLLQALAAEDPSSRRVFDQARLESRRDSARPTSRRDSARPTSRRDSARPTSRRDSARRRKRRDPS